MMNLFVGVVICGGKEANNNYQSAWIEYIRIDKRFPGETDFMLVVAAFFSSLLSLCPKMDFSGLFAITKIVTTRRRIGA